MIEKIGVLVLFVWGSVSLWLLVKEYFWHKAHPDEPKIIDD